MTKQEIAAVIDHTLLRPEATAGEIARLCAEARRHGFASVCINPYWVPAASAALANSSVRVCTVIGFPLGANATRTKVEEATCSVAQGAREVDMVINIGALRGGNPESVREDIAAVVTAAHNGGAIVKVIIETALLSNQEKTLACELAKDAGAEFVKTSTGFSTGGATPEDVALMRRAVGPDLGVKASGGVRTLDDLKKMLAAGATRIGTSSGVKIIESL